MYYQVLPKWCPIFLYSLRLTKPLPTHSSSYYYPLCVYLHSLSPSLSHSLSTVHVNSHTPFKRTLSPTAITTANTNPNENVQLCSLTEQSCQFYSHCIESHFRCGSLGFSQAYAETRCEKIRNLRHSDDACDECISNDKLLSWASHQEACLKQKLFDTVENEFRAKKSDPPNCLKLEEKGLKLIQECYEVESSRSLFCSALADDPVTFERDVQKIADHFRINSYYTTHVERTLKNLILSCGESHDPTIATIANSVLTTEGVHTPRIVFCTHISEFSQDEIDFPTAVTLVSEKLNRSEHQFEFSGIDHHRRCANFKFPFVFNPGVNDQLIFITWHPEPNDVLIDTLGGQARHQEMGEGHDIHTILFYEYAPLRSNENFPECGDGKRQAGELCDMGVWNSDAEDDEHFAGCDYSCQPVSNMECSTGQLESSECWSVACGDGVRSANEECDDGNRLSRDGCSSACKTKTERDYECSTVYNRTSVCVHVSEVTELTYPPATTSPPSSLRTSISHVPSTLAISTLPPPLTSSDSSMSHHSLRPPTIDGITSSSSTSTIYQRWRTVTLQCTVSVLLSCLSIYLMTR